MTGACWGLMSEGVALGWSGKVSGGVRWSGAGDGAHWGACRGGG